MLFPSELITLQIEREKLITDTWIEAKGLEVKIKPVMLTENGIEVQHDLDPFVVDVKRVGYQEGSVGKYDLEYKTKAVFINEHFQFQPISHDIMLEDMNETDKSSNFNEVYCFIQGNIVPKYSIITFEVFGNIAMRIEEVTKKRPLSDIHKYRLVRC